MCIARTVPILWASYYYFQPIRDGLPPEAFIDGLWTLALVVTVTLGFATPVTMPYLMYAYTEFDVSLGTVTLGTTFLCLLLGLFFLTGAGAQLSIDAWFLRARGPIGAIWRFLYSIVGVPSARQLRLVFLLSFAAYATMNFGALLFHLSDDAWLSGDLLRIVFTSSYLCRSWNMFRQLESFAPWAIGALSFTGSLGQVAFQGLMVPLLWTRWGARFVVAWGSVFFALSLGLLQLSYLPVLEILFWIALFHRPRPPAEPSTAGMRSLERNAWVARIMIVGGFAVLTVFAATNLPYTPDPTALSAHVSNPMFRRVGLEIPYVFNRQDLRMGDHWAVIYRDGSSEPLPYHGLQGERLSWVQWSDLFYFGNSLRWRRSFRGPGYLARDQDGFKYLLDVGRFDHRRRAAERSVYRIEYYATSGSNLNSPPELRFARRLLATDSFVCTGRELSVTCE